MSFTVKIINNETGEVCVDEKEAVCIAGAIAGKVGCHQLSASCCDPFVLASTLCKAEDAVAEFENNNAFIKAMKMVIQAAEKYGEAES